jgi:hypothetical protein
VRPVHRPARANSQRFAQSDATTRRYNTVQQSMQSVQYHTLQQNGTHSETVADARREMLGSNRLDSLRVQPRRYGRPHMTSRPALRALSGTPQPRHARVHHDVLHSGVG